MIRPRLSKVASGTKLTTDLVNGIINRTEYAADLLRQYKLVAGNGMYVEPHYDGTRVSYLQPVAGGATPRGLIISGNGSSPTPPTIVPNNGSNPAYPATFDEFFAFYGDTDTSADNATGTPTGEIYINLDLHNSNFAIYIKRNNYVSPPGGVLFAGGSFFAVQFPDYGQAAGRSFNGSRWEIRILNPGDVIGIAHNLDEAVAIQDKFKSGQI